MGAYFGALRKISAPSTVNRIGRETNWLMEFRNVVMPPAYITNGEITIAMQPAMVP